MDIRNPFDIKLEANPNMPQSFRGALVDCNDTLDFAWAAVRSIFGSAATPDHALAMLPIVMARAAELRRAPPSE